MSRSARKIYDSVLRCAVPVEGWKDSKLELGETREARFSICNKSRDVNEYKITGRY